MERSSLRVSVYIIQISLHIFGQMDPRHCWTSVRPTSTSSTLITLDFAKCSRARALSISSQISVPAPGIGFWLFRWWKRWEEALRAGFVHTFIIKLSAYACKWPVFCLSLPLSHQPPPLTQRCRCDFWCEPAKIQFDPKQPNN